MTQIYTTRSIVQTTTSHRRSFSRALCSAWFLFLLSMVGSHAQIQDRPKPGPEHKKLEVWVGEWTYQGTLHDTPFGPGGKFWGRQTVRLILDGLFLESRGEDKGTYGGKEMVYKSLNIRWFDPTTKTYVERSFDNDGFASNGSATVEGNTWINSGSMTDSKGKTYKTRTTSTFSADGQTCSHKSELSPDDGKTWMPYWEDTATKVGG